MRCASWFLIACVALGGSAFGGCAATTIRSSDYDRSCTSDRDCVNAEFEGDACNECCNEAAVNVREQQRYQRDLRRAVEACGDQIVQCAPCAPASRVACQRGLCVVSM